jgi:hypothetical protein
LLFVSPSYAEVTGDPILIDLLDNNYDVMFYAAEGNQHIMGYNAGYHNYIGYLHDSYNTSAKTVSYAPAINASTGQYDHVVSHLHIKEGETGSLNGLITLSDGSSIIYSVSGYNPNFINYRLTYSLSYNGAIKSGANEVNMFTDGKNGAIIDLMKNTKTDESFIAIFSDATTSTLGYDGTDAVLIPVSSGTYIVSVSFSSSCNVDFEAFRYDILTVGRTIANDPDQLVSSDSIVGQIVDILSATPGYVVSLLGMVLTLLGFALWVIDPTHLLLIIVSAESLIVLLALTTSRNVFMAMSKFARYNEQAFYAIQGIAQVTIQVLSEAAVFAYNVFQLINPLRWIFG